MKKYRILVGFLLSLGWFGCKKQLDLAPTDSIPPDKAFVTVADLQKGLEGVYEENAGAYNKVYIGSILADEAKPGSANIGQGIKSFQWEYTPDDASDQLEYLSDFSAYYSMIDAINKELASIDPVTPKNDAETKQKKRIKAELIALRGIAHFELLIRFMSGGYDPASPGVPILLSSDLLGQPARAKVGDVITQVKTDLFAGREETNIPDAPDDVTRLNQAAIAAYQARVALLTRDWSNTIVYAGQALQLSGKTLVDRNNFAAYWADADETETLWKMRNQLMPQSYWTSPGGDPLYIASNKLTGEFDTTGNDIRYGSYFTLTVSGADTFYLVNKYPGSAAGPQINDLKLVRVSELYLDMAEAFAHQNSLPNYLESAAANIDKIRQARIQSSPPTIFTDQQNAIDGVLDERFKELCFEGFRFFDLKRNALPVVRAASDVPPQLPWNTLPANDHRFALPIPQHEIFANHNMVQNPGY